MDLDIGQGATLQVGSDNYPYTVIEIIRYKTGAKKGEIREIVVQADDWTRISGSEFHGDAKYEYRQNTNNKVEFAHQHSNGQWYVGGHTPIFFSGRRYYRDPHY